MSKTEVVETVNEVMDRLDRLDRMISGLAYRVVLLSNEISRDGMTVAAPYRETFDSSADPQTTLLRLFWGRIYD